MNFRFFYPHFFPFRSSPHLQSLLSFLLQLCLAGGATLIVAGATAGLSTAIRHLLETQASAGDSEGRTNYITC